jgi:hypothetical protein
MANRKRTKGQTMIYKYNTDNLKLSNTTATGIFTWPLSLLGSVGNFGIGRTCFGYICAWLLENHIQIRTSAVFMLSSDTATKEISKYG